VSSQQLRVAAVADSRTRRPAVRRFRCPERSRKAPTRWRTEGLIGSGGLAHHRVGWWLGRDVARPSASRGCLLCAGG